MTRLSVRGWRTVLTPWSSSGGIARGFFFVALWVGLAGTAFAVGAPRPLKIYFVDVEGGQSTLVVSPSGKTLLIDAGYAGDGKGFQPADPAKARDANRIVAAARDAGVRRIDSLLITHFHDDHDGGVRELAQLMPIDRFIDHGAPSPRVAENTGLEQLDAFRVYSAVRSGAPQRQPAPGESLPLAGVKVTVVSSDGSTLRQRLPEAAAGINRACRAEAEPARDPYENVRSTGIVIRYGKFRFLDIGDLSGQPLFDLVCPGDLVGAVDVYLVAHHGGPDVADPATFAAFKPRVAVMNNGMQKGGARLTYEALHHVSSLEDVWQLHRSDEAADQNFPPPQIVNLDGSTAYWLELTAGPDGSFEIFNPRTRQRKSYRSRR